MIAKEQSHGQLLFVYGTFGRERGLPYKQRGMGAHGETFVLQNRSVFYCKNGFDRSTQPPNAFSTIRGNASSANKAALLPTTAIHFHTENCARLKREQQ